MSAWFVSVKTHGRVPQIYDRESWCGELAGLPCWCSTILALSRYDTDRHARVVLCSKTPSTQANRPHGRPTICIKHAEHDNDYNQRTAELWGVPVQGCAETRTSSSSVSIFFWYSPHSSALFAELSPDSLSCCILI